MYIVVSRESGLESKFPDRYFEGLVKDALRSVSQNVSFQITSLNGEDVELTINGHYAHISFNLLFPHHDICHIADEENIDR